MTNGEIITSINIRALAGNHAPRAGRCVFVDDDTAYSTFNPLPVREKLGVDVIVFPPERNYIGFALLTRPSLGEATSYAKGDAMEGPAIAAMLCGAVIGIAIGTLIGAIILRAAVSLYNKMAGGPNSPSAVPEPSMGQAMGIMLATSIVNFVVSFMIGVVGAGAAASGSQGPGVGLLAQAIALPVGLLVMSGLVAGMLPTTYGRAILVTLCYLLVAILVAVVIVGIFVVIALAFGAFAG